MRSATDYQQRVIKIAQELLDDEEAAITPTLISLKIDQVLGMNPKWNEGLNRDAVTAELIRRSSHWIGQDTTLKNDAGHVSWLDSERKKDWRYWQRYREFIEAKLSTTVVEKLNETTDTILGLLEDPLREGSWDRRGLVVGHVQSGKTGNYSGLICKAADAGYKIIIVLAGMHNNLRSQTQMRLDESFLGYETKPASDSFNPIGVGRIDGDPAIRPNFATNRSENGDFSTAVARNLGITPEQRPWLFVVKKNKTVLERLLKWVDNHVANTHDQETGRKIVTHLPILIIDDEADHASVDTGEQAYDSSGQPDEEHEPKTINRLIRQILFSFSKSAYVGYTATPFANIFIHERGKTKTEGPDLFPSSFIINLAAPSNYIGPAKVFGLQSDSESRNGLPLVRTISDYAGKDGIGGWMPQGHKNGHSPTFDGENAFPPSLAEAINAFILACAVKYLRDQRKEHASMLVHVTRFNSVQQKVYDQVDEYLRHARQRITRRIDDEGILSDLRELWEKDFVPTSAEMREDIPHLVNDPVLSWDEVTTVLADVVSDIQTKMINGTAKDALDYVEQEETGLKVIAIGGDKLARGLTLEGLCVSYFLRASRMYDTLMQMGRWFGYRPSYLDVCRLYTTKELKEWFGHIADAAEELREEFELMAASGSSPREYGLKVQSHPVLMVTSRLKMRAARNLMISFSGSLLETITFYRDKATLEKNKTAAVNLFEKIGSPKPIPERKRNDSVQKWEGYMWEHVKSDRVTEFLRAYRTHPDSHKVNGLILADFIDNMNEEGELTDWTVVLIGGGKGNMYKPADNISVSMLERSQKGGDLTKYSIGRLMSSRDEAIDLDEAAWKEALKITKDAWHADPARPTKSLVEPEAPNGPSIRKIRGFGALGIVTAAPERGVLYIYALDPALANSDLPEDTPDIIAFGISFPGSGSGRKVEYKVNNVLWEQEYGPPE